MRGKRTRLSGRKTSVGGAVPAEYQQVLALQVLWNSWVTLLRRSLSVWLLYAFLYTVQAAPPGLPVPPPPPSTPKHVADVRRRLARAVAVDVTANRALQYSAKYIAKAERAEQQGHSFVADRYADAADAFAHLAEHQRHLHENKEAPDQSPPEEIKGHLQRVYFRTEQSDYFAVEAHDEAVKPLPAWARDFYQLASRAYDRHDWLAAEENAHCAEELVKALESLAQAATLNIPPPPPAPPPLPKP